MRSVYIGHHQNQIVSSFRQYEDRLKSLGYKINRSSLEAYRLDDDWLFWMSTYDLVCKLRGLRADKVILLSGTSVAFRDIASLFSEPGCIAVIGAE